MGTSTYGRTMLEETPARTLMFLRGVGTSLPIRAALAERGYSADDHAEGWSLLHKVAGYGETKATLATDTAQQAIVTIDAWDEPTFRIARAALERLHPEQAEFVFANLEAATGPAAVLTVKTFLERLSALENSPERLATRNEDLAALQTLAKRGITTEERQRMQGLLDVARGFGPNADGNSTTESRRADLEALRAWYDDWSETAKIVITRRDQLIRLGLAKRKKPMKNPKADAQPVESSAP